MRAGTLRHRLTIKTVALAKDSFGGTTETETTLATVWGSLEPISGRELVLAQQTQAEVTHKAIVRYLPGLTPDDVLYFGTRKFQILAVINAGERSIQMELLCKEIL